MNLNDIMKGGQLAHRRKLVMIVVGIVGLIAAYLVGDVSALDALQQLAPVLLGP